MRANNSLFDISNLDLAKIIKDRVERGIENFFIALREAFDKCSGDDEHNIAALSDVNEISIFLAGNSSKAQVVKDLFNEYIGAKKELSAEELERQKEELANINATDSAENDTTAQLPASEEQPNLGRARELLGFGKDQKMPEFKIYPALGTEEAYELKEELGIDPERDNLEKPTGKTGVADGLLKSRESGNVKVIDITPDNTKVQFQYYIGRKKKRKFRTYIDRSTKMKQWYAFIDASASFDLLYTDAPIAATNTAPVTIAKQIHVNIEKPDPEAMVYIRPISSHAIEYTIAKSEEELLNPSEGQPEPIRIDLE